MSRFLPDKTSSPVRSLLKAGLLNTSNDTVTSTASAVLSGLSNEDVAIIDEIIDRAPPSTTAFLNVFKAYNEVLQEKGLNAGEDVLYYRLLLKLGIVKGKDWGERWKTVKKQMGDGPSTSQVKLHTGVSIPNFTISSTPTPDATQRKTNSFFFVIYILVFRCFLKNPGRATIIL